jgi:hypothetical protein
MTPIINPWVFYLISVADSIVGTATVLLIISVIIFAVAGFFVLMMLGEFDRDGDEFKTVSKCVKKAALLALLCFALSTFVPTENTITKMLIAQNVTYERVEKATDTVETVYGDIMALFEEAE